ncbi:LysE family translocator [Gymnodinialimonas sp.]
MSDLTTLLAIGGAFVVVASSPGPANLAAATVAMANGRRVGLVFALGLSVGLAFWGVLAAVGLGAILSQSATALLVLKILGGAYLLWLAWQSGKSAMRRGPSDASAAPQGGGRWFWRGLLLNLSNPKAVFAWMAALSVGLDPSDGTGAVIGATVMCAVIGLINATGHAWVFSFPGIMARYRRARRWIDGTVAALFAGAGFGLIRSALAR